MRPPQSSQAMMPSSPVTNRTYQDLIPWWSDISPAVRNALALAPLISIPERVDVIVIGGGVAGLSAALSARASGAEVLLLEKEAILGYGATGRNAGILSAGINMALCDLPADSADRAFWPATTSALLELIAAAKQPDSLLCANLTGSLSLAETRHAARKLEREGRARVSLGLRATIWTPDQAAAITEGRLDVQSVISVLWLPDEGRIQPLSLLAYLAQQARRAGVLLAGQASVTACQEVAGAGSCSHWQVTLADGRHIQSQSVIRAVGPTTQPDARIYALAFAADLPDSFPLFWDASPYTYADYRPGNGRLGVSGGRYGKVGATRQDARYLKRLADSTRRWLPELAGQEPSFTWAVDIQVAADMVPQLRPLGTNISGVAIEGLGALGVLPGIVLGRRAGELVTR